MSTDVVVSGVTFHVPDYNDGGWGQGSGNVQQLLIALAAVTASTPSLIVMSSVAITPKTVVSGNTYLIASNTLAVTLQLPSPAINTFFFVVDSGGNSLVNNITVKRAATEKIGGVSADLVLNTNYGVWGFISDGTDWFIFMGNIVHDDSDGHLYRITTVNGIVTSQQVA